MNLKVGRVTADRLFSVSMPRTRHKEDSLCRKEEHFEKSRDEDDVSLRRVEVPPPTGD